MEALIVKDKKNGKQTLFFAIIKDKKIDVYVDSYMYNSILNKTKDVYLAKKEIDEKFDVYAYVETIPKKIWNLKYWYLNKDKLNKKRCKGVKGSNEKCVICQNNFEKKSYNQKVCSEDCRREYKRLWELKNIANRKFREIKYKKSDYIAQNKGSNWTSKDDNYIIKSINNKTYTQIAINLGRTYNSIKYRIVILRKIGKLPPSKITKNKIKNINNYKKP